MSLKPTLEKLYRENTRDNGHMGAEDILVLADNLGKQYPNIASVSSLQMDAETAQIIVDSLDKDKNGTIELEEWTDWMLKGMKKASVQREMFAQGGASLSKLRDFLEAVEIVVKTEAGQPGLHVMARDVEGGNLNTSDDSDELPGTSAGNSEAIKDTPPKTVVFDPKQVLKERIKKEGVLKKVAALASLPDEHLDAIADAMEYYSFDEDNPLIIEQGTVADRLYVIASGTVSIMSSGKEGWPVERERKKELQFFGEECLLDIENQRYSVSAVATGEEEVQVFKLNVKTNDILKKNSADVVAAARADRRKYIGTKFAKKFRDNFLARKRKSAGDDTAVAQKEADKDNEGKKEPAQSDGTTSPEDTPVEGGANGSDPTKEGGENKAEEEDKTLVNDWG